mgnify:CR=1 FL=1
MTAIKTEGLLVRPIGNTLYSNKPKGVVNVVSQHYHQPAGSNDVQIMDQAS